MKTATIQERIELYVECPNCNGFISDYDGYVIESGTTIECPSCNERFEIE